MTSARCPYTIDLFPLRIVELHCPVGMRTEQFGKLVAKISVIFNLAATGIGAPSNSVSPDQEEYVVDSMPPVTPKQQLEVSNANNGNILASTADDDGGSTLKGTTREGYPMKMIVYRATHDRGITR